MEGISETLLDDFDSDRSVNPDEIVDYLECSLSDIDSQPHPPKRKCPERVRWIPSKPKYRGMKSYELKRILDTDVIKFCEENGLIASSATCSCGKPMECKVEKGRTRDFGKWKCRKTENGVASTTTLSIRKGTWFEGSKLPMSDILWMAYMWIYEYSFSSMMHECDHTNQTIVDWTTSCRDVCQAIMECKSDRLGGPEKFVEIFDCQLGTDQGGMWVFCALEQLSCKLALVFVKDRTSESLLKIFDEFILPGSTVLTNIWSCFVNFTVDDFDYLVSTKSITLYDTVDKTDICDYYLMEAVAARAPAINKWTKYRYGTRFCELIYRKSLSFSEDAYLTFLQDVATIYTPVNKYSKPETEHKKTTIH